MRNLRLESQDKKNGIILRVNIPYHKFCEPKFSTKVKRRFTLLNVLCTLIAVSI